MKTLFDPETIKRVREFNEKLSLAHAWLSEKKKELGRPVQLKDLDNYEIDVELLQYIKIALREDTWKLNY